MKDIKKSITVIVFIVIYLLLGSVSLVRLNEHLDEKEFHIPTVKLFMEMDFVKAINSDKYTPANTPLPYLIDASILKVTGIDPTVVSLRMINIIVSIGALIVVYFLIKKRTAFIVYPLMIVLFYPYFLKPAFLFFMSIYGLIFYLLFLFVIKSDKNFSGILSGTFLALGVLCQQFYAVLDPAGVGYLLLKENGYSRIKNIILYLLPFVIPFILFINWGGLTHPNSALWNVSFNVVNVTSVFIAMGSTMFPFVVYKYKAIKKTEFIVIISMSLILTIFLYPKWNNVPEPGGISGLTFHFIDIVVQKSILIALILKVSLCAAGISLLIIFYKSVKEAYDLLLFIFWVVLILGFCLSNIISERHLLPLVITSYLFAFTLISEERFYKVWSLIQFFIGGIYFYYIMFKYQL
jgi:hypothetical protein